MEIINNKSYEFYEVKHPPFVDEGSLIVVDDMFVIKSILTNGSCEAFLLHNKQIILTITIENIFGSQEIIISGLEELVSYFISTALVKNQKNKLSFVLNKYNNNLLCEIEYFTKIGDHTQSKHLLEQLMEKTNNIELRENIRRIIDIFLKQSEI